MGEEGAEAERKAKKDPNLAEPKDNLPTFLIIITEESGRQQSTYLNTSEATNLAPFLRNPAQSWLRKPLRCLY